MYAQVIDDLAGRTLASASTTDPEVREKAGYGGNVQAAQAVGELVARRALEAGVKQAAFDRREYKYHGRVAAVADAARDAGLDLGAKKKVTAEEGSEKKKSGPKKVKAAAKDKPAKDKTAAKGRAPAKDAKSKKGKK